jgi:hypothetical protein
MRNLSDKLAEKIKTHILCSKTPPPPPPPPKKWDLWDNVQKYGRARQVTNDNTMGWMQVMCWITEHTDTHSEYAILIAFPSQQWLDKCASMSHYTCIVCLVYRILTITVIIFWALKCVLCYYYSVWPAQVFQLFTVLCLLWLALYENCHCLLCLVRFTVCTKWDLTECTHPSWYHWSRSHSYPHGYPVRTRQGSTNPGGWDHR